MHPSRETQRHARVAAGAGSLGGAVLSILQQAPMLPHAAATAVSCTVAVSLFSGATRAALSVPVALLSPCTSRPRDGAAPVLKEGVRALRCTDGAANSAVACAASSYLLVFLYSAPPGSGPCRAVPAPALSGCG